MQEFSTRAYCHVLVGAVFAHSFVARVCACTENESVLPWHHATMASEGKSAGKAEESADEHKGSWHDINVTELDIGSRIGGGGFAIVYKARWRGADVAVKTLVRAMRLSNAALAACACHNETCN